MTSAAGIAYERRGAGEPLLLVHGLGSRRQIWNPLLDSLARQRDVIAVDLPGFGESPALPGAGVVELTDRLAEFSAELGLARPHVAGNSMGGGIALELGARGLARTVVAFSPIGYWGAAGRRWCQWSLSAARALLGRSGPLLPRVLATAAGRTALLGLVFGRPAAVAADVALADVRGLVDAPGFADACASFAGYRPPAADRLAQVPVTIAWGSRDVLLTYRTQSALARRALPAARHVTLPGLGHTPFYDDPAACAAELLAAG